MSLTMRRRLTSEKLAAAVHGIFNQPDQETALAAYQLVREQFSATCAKAMQMLEDELGRCVDVHGVSLRALEPHFKHEPNRAHQQRDPPPHEGYRRFPERGVGVASHRHDFA